MSLDITGPRPPAGVEAFVNDRDPDAYERFADQLLRSPHWGEHRGRYWPDAAATAIRGIHVDNFREIWTYRDWVINAFNRNPSFGSVYYRTVGRRPIAESGRLSNKLARASTVVTSQPAKAAAIAEEYAVLYTRDARKPLRPCGWDSPPAALFATITFDPLSQKEFYSMAAFFNNTTASDGRQHKDTPPVVSVPAAE